MDIFFSPILTHSLKALGILPEAEAPFATAGDGITNVEVPRVAQNGSSLEFSVTWADGGGVGGLEDTAPLVDIWLAAQQADPPAWVELAVQLVRKTKHRETSCFVVRRCLFYHSGL